MSTVVTEERISSAEIQRRIDSYKPPVITHPEDALKPAFSLDTEAGPAFDAHTALLAHRRMEIAVADRERVRTAYKERFERLQAFYSPAMIWVMQLPTIIDDCDDLFVGVRTMLNASRDAIRSREPGIKSSTVPVDAEYEKVRRQVVNLIDALRACDTRITEAQAALKEIYPEWKTGVPRQQSPGEGLTEAEKRDIGGIDI